MIRLDEYLVKYNLFETRTKAKQAILRGEIFISGNCVPKSSTQVEDKLNHSIEYKPEKQFVSLGGYKLDKGLNDFDLPVKGLICADIGCSTGGFTDCLLQRGAKNVYAVDLNENLLHPTLKKDDRVIEIIENAKNLTTDNFSRVDLIVADLSFISLSSVVNVFYDLLNDIGKCILLIKPQFEMDKKVKFKNGIIRDNKIWLDACLKIRRCALDNKFYTTKITSAPISKDKNLEFLILLEKSNNNGCITEIEISNFIHKITNNS